VEQGKQALSAVSQALPYEESGLASVDLVLNLVEYLAVNGRSHAMTDIAREMGISKARAHRHLRALVQHGYVRQDRVTERYEAGVKLLSLGEAVRDRFDVLSAARPEIGRLRDATGQTVTISALVDGQVVVLELLQGKSVVEFSVRPGSTLEFHASAHGAVALAFGPPQLAERVLSRPLKAFTPSTLTDPKKLKQRIAKVRARGWATAADELLVGVNALAVPVFDFRGEWCGTIAIVGPTQFVAETPSKQQLAQIVSAAQETSRRMGWRPGRS
jgi:DNA-binding IclR family transcriptional regulator